MTPGITRRGHYLVGRGRSTIPKAIFWQKKKQKKKTVPFIAGLIRIPSLTSFHYFRPPLFNRPPASLPDPKHEPGWYGEIWLKYPLGRTLFPSSSGDVFKARAEFAIIQNEAAQRLFAGSTPAPQLSAAEVAVFYFRFKGWYDSLPEALSPRRAVLPAHLKLQ